MGFFFKLVKTKISRFHPVAEQDVEECSQCKQNGYFTKFFCIKNIQEKGCDQVVDEPAQDVAESVPDGLVCKLPYAAQGSLFETKVRFPVLIINFTEQTCFSMRAVIQRVSRAHVQVDGVRTGSIGVGLLVLVGIEDADREEDLQWLSTKIVNLRIFNDDQGVMNRSVHEAGGELLVVSQFTLHASTKKGNRPSYIRASKPDFAIPLYEQLKASLSLALGKAVQSGVFGADMKVELVNDGPVTILIDTKNKE
jgi:D-aminoacyl-tRNA deacylase